MQSWQHVCITSSGSPRIFERVINQSSTLCRRYVGNPQKRLRRLSRVHAAGDFSRTKYLALVSCHKLLNDYFGFPISCQVRNSDVNCLSRRNYIWHALLVIMLTTLSHSSGFQLISSTES
ncbi:hypothetical protein BDR06DRAFT_301319 [Suillus hirtellus]|nr:hypothetical protein BDR06DRAFT_301319 [Suillus hirtellus]